MIQSSRVLVVDDEESIVRLARYVLAARGFTVDTAADGEEALAKARLTKPDVIVSDVMMPRLDGLALLRTLRADPAFALVPVILLSALSSTKDRLAGLRTGADDYLPKPFHADELALRVANAAKHRLRLRHTLALRDAFLRRKEAGTAPAPKSQPPAAPASEAGLQGSLEHFALSTLLSLFAIDATSGLLVARHGEITGRLIIREGRVTSARLEGGARARGRDAVVTMLHWKTGTFEYDALTVDTPDEIGMTTTQLLVEGARSHGTG